MDKISVDALFPSEEKKRAPLDLNDLFAQPTQVNDERPSRRERPFDVNQLIETQDRIDRKIAQAYRDVYELCLEKIEHANLLRKFDLLFEIPLSVFNNPIVDFKDCADYTIKKLRENHIDAFHVSRRKIFVTWVNIRKNKQDARDEKRKKKKSESKSD